MKSHEIPIKSLKVEDITGSSEKACQTLTLMLKIGQVHAGPKRLQGSLRSTSLVSGFPQYILIDYSIDVMYSYYIYNVYILIYILIYIYVYIHMKYI